MCLSTDNVEFKVTNPREAFYPFIMNKEVSKTRCKDSFNPQDLRRSQSPSHPYTQLPSHQGSHPASHPVSPPGS